jgi:hypothetical protein
MAIETLISDLIAALQANTEALESHTALLKGGISNKKPKADVESDDEAPKKNPKKAAKEQKAPKKAVKKAALTLDDVKAAFGEYLAVEDKEELADRKANVGMILAAFKVKQVRDLSEDQFDDALEMLKEYVDQAEAGDSDEDGEDGDDESLI